MVLLTKKGGVNATVNVIYKCDPLHFLCTVCKELIGLLASKHASYKWFRESDYRFGAQLPRFNAIAYHTSFLDAMWALMLLANANADSGQTFLIHAAAWPSSDVSNRVESTNKMLEMVQFDFVATVMQKCDDQSISIVLCSTILSIYATTNNKQHGRNRRNKWQNHMTREQKVAAKKTLTCNRCRLSVYWINGRKRDGSLHDKIWKSMTPTEDDTNIHPKKSTYR